MCLGVGLNPFCLYRHICYVDYSICNVLCLSVLCVSLLIVKNVRNLCCDQILIHY